MGVYDEEGRGGVLHFTGAVISKNTWFCDCCTKAVCVESGGVRMRPPQLTPATLQLSFNPLREDLSKLKLGARSLNCLFFFFLNYKALRDTNLKPATCSRTSHPKYYTILGKTFSFKQYHSAIPPHNLVCNWWLNLVNYCKKWESLIVGINYHIQYILL